MTLPMRVTTPQRPTAMVTREPTTTLMPGLATPKTKLKLCEHCALVAPAHCASAGEVTVENSSAPALGCSELTSTDTVSAAVTAVTVCCRAAAAAIAAIAALIATNTA
eukprot:5543-Heterococcus_DN1.PRE.2